MENRSIANMKLLLITLCLFACRPEKQPTHHPDTIVFNHATLFNVAFTDTDIVIKEVIMCGPKTTVVVAGARTLSIEVDNQVQVLTAVEVINENSVAFVDQSGILVLCHFFSYPKDGTLIRVLYLQTRTQVLRLSQALVEPCHKF